MQLEHQFYNTVKGTSTISTYCQTLRNIADWLDDVDAPVTENQLVLQALRGLPDDLSKQRTKEGSLFLHQIQFAQDIWTGQKSYTISPSSSSLIIHTHNTPLSSHSLSVGQASRKGKESFISIVVPRKEKQARNHPKFPNV
ncbi:unnamed protein product [Cuscuta campestris]|uniref:Uncharacterized protein n=1 Tax=Cuscuta campestris TaxID=132261 RepID=A0A484KKQ4_9ASTE|nr:unnamed protein product [Cuscuta campestris]